MVDFIFDNLSWRMHQNLVQILNQFQSHLTPNFLILEEYSPFSSIQHKKYKPILSEWTTT